MTIRHAVCSYCGRLLVEGEPPTVFGCCVVCGERISRQRKREELARARKAYRRPAQTEEQLNEAGDPFARLLED